MSSSVLKNELADHIYQYLCHEAQYSDLPEDARESLTAATECIEQAYKLNVNNNTNLKQQSSDFSGTSSSRPSQILPDELLRIFTRHKEFLLQQKKNSIKYSMRNKSDSSTEKPDIRVNSHPLAINDSHNSANPSNNPNTNSALNVQQQSGANVNPSSSSSGQVQPPPTTKQHSQHPISQLPMTTRKKLSHLRAQIKRQASKAARSRSEKRSSVSGVVSSGSGHLGRMLGGNSLDSNNTTSNSKQTGDGYNIKDSGNLVSSASIDSPNTYTSNPSTSTPAGPAGQLDSNLNSTSPPGQQNESGTSSSGAKQSGHLLPGSHHGVSGNLKQKLIALIKKFRTDGSDFDSEEQYREALERELIKAAAGRGSRAIEELLEEDIDVEGDSGSEPEDWDNLSESSTPKPSLRPFFSSTTLDKI